MSTTAPHKIPAQHPHADIRLLVDDLTLIVSKLLPARSLETLYAVNVFDRDNAPFEMHPGHKGLVTAGSPQGVAQMLSIQRISIRYSPNQQIRGRSATPEKIELRDGPYLQVDPSMEEVASFFRAYVAAK